MGKGEDDRKMKISNKNRAQKAKQRIKDAYALNINTVMHISVTKHRLCKHFLHLR